MLIQVCPTVVELLVFLTRNGAGGWLDGRGGFVTRPSFNGQEMPETGCAIVDTFLHQSQGGFVTRPYVYDETNPRYRGYAIGYGTLKDRRH